MRGQHNKVPAARQTVGGKAADQQETGFCASPVLPHKRLSRTETDANIRRDL